MDESKINQRPGAIIVSAIIAIRLVAALLFLYTFTNELTVWALCIFLVAVFTDALDGYVARRLGGATPFLGPYSDAVVDFVFVLAAFWAFVSKNLYPFWTLLLIITLFAQFILTSGLSRPVYDPVGKYFGLFLFGAIGVTLVLPDTAAVQVVLAGILGFSAVAVISRSLFLLGLGNNRVPKSQYP